MRGGTSVINAAPPNQEMRDLDLEVNDGRRFAAGYVGYSKHGASKPPRVARRADISFLRSRRPGWLRWG